MEVAKGVQVDYVEGKIVATVEVKEVVMTEIEKIEAKLESGEIDLIKGTDFDKTLALQGLALVKELL